MVNKFDKRKKRVRSKISGTKTKPRLSVFRSNTEISAQLINDESGTTLVSYSSKDLPKTKTKVQDKVKIATLVGEELAKKAKNKKISKVVFDRGGYKYHGRVKALADGARKEGLKF